MSSPEFNTITLERRADIAVLTLNRPDSLNALTFEMIDEALGAMETLSNQPMPRAMIITGAGRGFCAGADLMPDADLEGHAGSAGDAIRRSFNPLISAITEAPFPVAAAVNGPIAGGGVGLALAADFIIASRSMSMQLTFSRIGMGLDGGSSWFLAHLLGVKRAAAVALLVEPIDAQKALEWGLAWKVVDDDQLMAEAAALAERLAAGPTLAFAAQKKQLLAAVSRSLEEALEDEAEVQDRLIKTADLKEGVAAFRERRRANYKGC